MLRVELPQEEWMKLLNMIAEQPFKHVAQLIQNIQQQIVPQIKAAEQQSGNSELRPAPEGKGVD